MSTTVELWGGPWDGREMTVNNLHTTLNFPVLPEISWMTEAPSSTNAPDGFRIAVYTTRTERDRYNSKGLVVFEWRGIR